MAYNLVKASLKRVHPIKISYMIKLIKKEWTIFTLSSLFILVYFWGMPQVPFHPDESTHIYMSQDLAILFYDPLSLAMVPGQELTQDATYRALDAPLGRYLIGIGRFILKEPTSPSDWDWSANWQTNIDSGALPTPELLFASRLISTLLLPFTVILFYFSTRVVLPKVPSLIAAAYLGLHPLLLIHTRRAMSESVLLFGVVFFLWTLTKEKRNPLLIGLALAVAVNSKLTALALLPVGIIAVCWSSKGKLNLKELLAKIAELTLVFLVISLLLNPFYWKNPIQALKVSFQTRQALTQQQVNDHLSGHQLNLPTKVLSTISHLYILPPTLEETGNYLSDTNSTALAYFSFPLHSWGRGLIFGSIFISLTLGGILIAIKRYPKTNKHQKIAAVFFLMTTIILFGAISFFIPLPWQRYVVPLLPFTAVWIGYSLLPLNEYIDQGRA